MSLRAIQFRLGAGAMALSIFLVVHGIPSWVSSPANVGKIVLSPVFWPMVLAVILGLVGAGLLLAARRNDGSADTVTEGSSDRLFEFARLVLLAVLMVATVYALPRLGLVWTSMLTIVSLALLIRSRYPRTVLSCAIVVPLVLYVFFAHVAGVAIPQGDFLRLP